MNITIFGSGYVGLVTAACFADVGNDVLCVDIDAGKVQRLRQGQIPIYEPGLTELVLKNAAEGRLRFTTDAAEGVAHGLYQFIAVGTPPNEDGSADLQYVLAVARSIATHMSEYRIVISKSTVPVGTVQGGHQAFAERGEPVLDTGRYSGEDVATDKAVALQVAQALRQHALRNVRYGAFEFAETMRPRRQGDAGAVRAVQPQP